MSCKTADSMKRRGWKSTSAMRKMPMGMFGYPLRKCELCHCTFSPLRGDETRCRACSERSVRSLVIDHLANN